MNHMKSIRLQFCVLFALFQIPQTYAQEKRPIQLDTSDFLNSYFLSPSFKSASTMFKIRLAKVVVGAQIECNRNSSRENQKMMVYQITSNEIDNPNSDYESDNIIIPEFVAYLPEILDISDIEFYNSVPGRKITSESSFLDVSQKSSVDSFNAGIPQFNVLKNKLFTIQHKDKDEESFVITASYDTMLLNNGNITLSVSLANENISDKSKNMLWRFFVLQDNAFLALSYSQLIRLGLPLIPLNQFSELNEQGVLNFFYNKNIPYDPIFDAAGGLYLSRKSNPLGNQLDPESLIYLFKIDVLE